MEFTWTQFDGTVTHKYSLESDKRGMSARVRIETIYDVVWNHDYLIYRSWRLFGQSWDELFIDCTLVVFFLVIVYTQ